MKKKLSLSKIKKNLWQNKKTPKGWYTGRKWIWVFWFDDHVLLKTKLNFFIRINKFLNYKCIFLLITNCEKIFKLNFEILQILFLHELFIRHKNNPPLITLHELQFQIWKLPREHRTFIKWRPQIISSLHCSTVQRSLLK